MTIMSTLPYMDEILGTSLIDRNIQRSCNRWSWFAHAEEIDNERRERYGTLRYLPHEIRDIIFGMLLDDILEFFCLSDDRDRRRSVEALKHRHLRYDPYHSGYRLAKSYDLRPDVQVFTRILWWPDPPRRKTNLTGLEFRGASLTLGNEFDEFFLRSCSFSFDDPESLISFLQRLSPIQRACLRRIKLCLLAREIVYDYNPLSCHGCKISRKLSFLERWPKLLRGWVSVTLGLSSALAGLVSVDIELGRGAHQEKHTLGSGCWYNAGAFPSRCVPDRRAYEIDINYKRVISLVDVLSKRFKRVAPGVRIMISDLHQCSTEDQEALRTVLDEIE